MKWYKNVLVVFLVILAGGFSVFAQNRKEIKDDPINREIYETKRLVDPVTGKIPKNIRERELQFSRTITSGGLKSINATGWINRGPFNVGGRTRAIAVDVNNEDIILAGGVSGGMWRSTDGGSSWTLTTAPDQLHSVTAIAQDNRAGHTNTFYYVTGEYLGNSASATGASFKGDGVFKSDDGGQTWTQLESTVSGTPEDFDQYFDYCWNVKVSPATGSVFVATYGAIKRSQDGGDTWKTVFESNTNGNYSYATDVEVSSTGVVYAAFSSEGDKHGFYRSDSDGDENSWTEITPNTFPKDYERTVIAIAPSNENVVYFLTHNGGENADGHNLWKYVYDPDNDNYTWSDLSSNIPDENGKTGSFDSQGGYDLLIKVKPDDDKFVIIGGTDLWRSTDGFSSTSNYSKIGGYKPTNNIYEIYTNHHADQHSLVFFKTDAKKVISGHDGGLSLTNDITKTTEESDQETVIWSSLDAGYLTTQAYAVAMNMDDYGDVAIISGFQDNGTFYINDDNEQGNWSNVNGGDGGYCAIADNGNSLYSSSQNGTVYRDWDGKWTRVDPDGATGQDFINPFILDPNDNKIMYYPAGEFMWRNSDLTAIAAYNDDPTTQNWSKLTNSQVAGSVITALDVSDEPANILYFGTDQGKVYKVENANTGDPVKTDITGDNFPNDANVGCVKVNPYDANEVLVSFTNYEVVSIWHTSDGGNTWGSVSGNLEENVDGSGSGPSVRWVEILKKHDNTKIYFAGTSTGLYSTTLFNGNNTQWKNESPDLIGNVIVDMVKVRKDGTVLAGTHGNGVYSAKFDVTNAIRDHRTDNVNARIYPNPSTGIFTIDVQSDMPDDYKVVIFNMSGQAVYYSNLKSIGNIHQDINLTSQPKGVYNVQIMKGEKAFTYKLVLR